MEEFYKSLLKAVGIGGGALELAVKVNNLKNVDLNVQKVEFVRHSILGYSGIPFLVASVKLERPFSNLEDFEKYLQKHNLPLETLFDKDLTSCFSFAKEAYTSNAFHAEFF